MTKEIADVKPPICHHLPTSSQKPQARILTTQEPNTCLTSGYQTVTSIQCQANTGTQILLHSHTAFALHSCTKEAHCRMPNTDVLSSSDSEDDGVTESWKVNPENSKPKQRQVCGKSTALKPMFVLFTTLLHSTSLLTELLLVPMTSATHFLAAAEVCSALMGLTRLCSLALQVFYCSRTHSQLSQFISELQRTSFADTVATVALASRKVPLMLSCHTS